MYTCVLLTYHFILKKNIYESTLIYIDCMFRQLQ